MTTLLSNADQIMNVVYLLCLLILAISGLLAGLGVSKNKFMERLGAAATMGINAVEQLRKVREKEGLKALDSAQMKALAIKEAVTIAPELRKKVDALSSMIEGKLQELQPNVRGPIRGPDGKFKAKDDVAA